MVSLHTVAVAPQLQQPHPQQPQLLRSTTAFVSMRRPVVMRARRAVRVAAAGGDPNAMSQRDAATRSSLREKAAARRRREKEWAAGDDTMQQQQQQQHQQQQPDDDDFAWAAAAEQRSSAFRERSGTGTAAGRQSTAKGPRGKLSHVAGPEKGGMVAPRSQRHAAVQVNRVADASSSAKRSAAKAAAAKAPRGEAGRDFRSVLESCASPDEVLAAAAAADVAWMSGGNAALALSRVAALARQTHVTLSTDTRPLARRCSALVERVVLVVQEEQALAMGMLPVHGKLPARRKLALRQLVDVIRSLASLDAAPVYEDAMQVLLGAACARIVAADVPSKQVNELVWALARARHMPTARVSAALDHWLTQGGFTALPAERAVSFLWAVARLHYASPAARTALRSWQPQPAQLQTHQLVASLWALAVVGEVAAPSFLLLWTALLQRGMPAPSTASAPVWSQLHHVWMAVLLDAPPTVQARLMEGPEAQALEAECNAVWWEKFQHWVAYPSSYHRGVEATLCTMGITHKMEWPAMGHVMDISLPDHGVAIEIDGPSHFATNMDSPLGPTIMKRRHLRAQGWAVMDVPIKDWDLLPDARSQAAYLEDRLMELGKNVVPSGSSQG